MSCCTTCQGSCRDSRQNVINFFTLLLEFKCENLCHIPKQFLYVCARVLLKDWYKNLVQIVATNSQFRWGVSWIPTVTTIDLDGLTVTCHLKRCQIRLPNKVSMLKMLSLQISSAYLYIDVYVKRILNWIGWFCEKWWWFCEKETLLEPKCISHENSLEFDPFHPGLLIWSAIVKSKLKPFHLNCFIILLIFIYIIKNP